ncbi:3-oxoacyl-[acyl-carrier-protein] reductase FabG [Halotydeus destructor]|nr:3-oxoacyl-[acyl-carrier-protein] reductase FabG [Halotydeus destructor]
MPANWLDFTGKTILVTGSSSGIGEDVAINFSKQNGDVIITGREESRLEAVALKCSEASPRNVKPLVIVADLASEEGVMLVQSTIVEVHGKLNVLINNAGVYGIAHVLDADFVKLFDSMISTNLRAVVNLTHKLAPMLLENKASIVNISSVLSSMPCENSIAYSVAKAGLDMFTKSLAIDLAPGVRVNGVKLAIMKTPLIARATNAETMAQLEDWCQENYLVPRAGRVDDATSAILYLAHNDRANFVTGQTIAVDGGYTCTAKTFKF